MEFPIIGVDFFVPALLASEAGVTISRSDPPPPASVVPGLYILDEFPEVVNMSKRLPEAYHGVVHHIVTTGPPIETKFHRLDGKKLHEGCPG